MTTNLTNGACLLIRNVLSQPGWASTVAEIYNGGKLVTEKLSFADPNKSEDLVWLKEEQEIEFSADEIATIKTAYEALASKKVLPVNDLAVELISKLGLL